MAKAVWTDGDKAYIRLNAGRLTDDEMAAHFTRERGVPVARSAVQKFRQRMGLKKLAGRGRTEVDHRASELSDKLKREA